MFETLTERLNTVFKKLKGQGRITEENVKDALRQIRLSLLEADVNYKVVKNFIASVQEKAVGQEVLSSITPGQLIVKIVHDELVELLGTTHSQLTLSGSPPFPVLLVGLQGSGKTTTIAKLAYMLKKGNKHRPYLVPADVYRPAAIDQLVTLAKQINVPCYPSAQSDDPVDICKKAVKEAIQAGCDVVLIDTAGRLQVDEPLMEELEKIKAAVHPSDILLVVDAMTGQEAVKVAEAFHERLDLGGVILTKLDGDARGGAALSIKAVIGRPIKYVGVGEKIEDLEAFHPDRMASRILGMGDILTLVEKAQETFDQKQVEKFEKKLKKNAFTLEDFRDQLQQIRKMGSLESLLSMIPGMQKMKGNPAFQPDEKELIKVEAIINSMTRKERLNHAIINGSRRKRIARGSGTTVQDVNNLLKRYVQAKKMMKRFSKMGKRKSFGRGDFPFPM